MKKDSMKILVRQIGYGLYGIALSIALAGCGLLERKTNENPEGYDLNNPMVIKLPIELDEISGVAYYPPDTCVFAIVDEDGVLYKIFLNRPKQIEKWPFGNKSDYEDLVLLDSSFYVLSSKGNISAFRFLSKDTLAFQEYPLTTIGSGNEFEILYYDKTQQKIVMICKDCDADKKHHLSSFTFNPSSNQYDNSRFIIDVTRIAALAGEEKIKFKPSAAAIHPLTGDLYIISSVNLLLVVADQNGTAKKVYKLARGTFKQPEGLTFTPEGDMIISNEAADQGVANIMIFKYNQTVYKSK
ncbi:MAG TPA: SdiA-regulated domain-containing protein [Flavipsychrobacter sp.]|nr:SdiA-regulated domain-containing protein [Flavipsychrobacter sp.]